MTKGIWILEPPLQRCTHFGLYMGEKYISINGKPLKFGAYVLWQLALSKLMHPLFQIC